MSTYLVEWADWLPVSSDSDDEEIKLSDKIDYRTFRSKHFDELGSANVFANLKLEDSDEWLAFLEIKEVSIIKKLK